MAWLRKQAGRRDHPRRPGLRRHHRALAELAADPARATCTPPSRAPAPTASSSPPDAIAAGAVAVLTDPDGRRRGRPPGRTRSSSSSDPRALLGRLAARVYGDPATALRMIGVTGTQGKTTTTRLAESGLQRAGVRSAVIGTVGTRVAGDRRQDRPDDAGGARPARPVRDDARARRGRLRDGGVQPRAGDGPGRRRGLRRRRLHQPRPRPPRLPRRRRGLLPRPRPRCSPPSGPGWAWSTSTTSTAAGWLAEATIPMRTFSLTGRDADWRAVDVELDGRPARRSRCSAPTASRSTPASRCPATSTSPTRSPRSPRRPRPGFDTGRVAAGIAAGGGVPGRLERVDAGQDFVVVVDYAHKPDAVEAALADAAAADRRPGDRRDRRRRRPRPRQAPDHGRDRRAARRRARGHRRQPAHRGPGGDPGRGPGGRARRGGAEVLEVGDRRAAIREAVRRAAPGDIVLVAGKGHETGQEIAGVVHPFDDREVARRASARSWPPDDPADPRRDRRRRRGRRVDGDPATVVTGPAFVDSRAVVPGGLFVAVAGEHVDGHDVRRAAPSPPAPPPCSAPGRPGVPAVVVDDPVAALGLLARHVLDRLPDVTVLALTGSPGQDRHQGLPRPGARPPPARRSPPPATSTTSSACRSPCCGPTPTTRVPRRRDGRPRRRPHRLPVPDRAARRRRGAQRRHRPPRRVRQPRGDRAGQGRDRRGARPPTASPC